MNLNATTANYAIFYIKYAEVKRNVKFNLNLKRAIIYLYIIIFLSCVDSIPFAQEYYSLVTKNIILKEI